MAIIAGQHTVHPVGGIVSAVLTPALHAYALDNWPASCIAASLPPHGVLPPSRPVDAHPQAITAWLPRSYQLDYYNRVHITPATMALGNVITAQQRSVAVWNAWLDRPLTLTGIDLVGLDGIALSGQGNPPLTLAPFQQRDWSVTIGLDGSPALDGRVVWRFDVDASVSLSITGNRVAAWTFAPNWESGITERLEWLTLVERGASGDETSTPLRETPRRSWEFMPLVEGVARQRLEAMLYDGSSRAWAVPVFTDPGVLVSLLPAGALAISFDASSLDYVSGGLAILITSALRFEVVQVDSVTATGITLKSPTQEAWAAGTRVFPMRFARLDDWPSLERHTGRLLGGSGVRFIATDANDWPAQMPAARYRNRPVLETRPEWSENPQITYARDVERIDNGAGAVMVDDVTGLPWPTQTHRWQLYGRREHDGFRRLLYALQGRFGQVWLPTWADDLQLAGDLLGDTAAMSVTWHGYTNYLRQQPGRRDIRLELADGSVLYRRITSSAEVGTTIEQLGVDAPWPATIPAASVLRISYMGLCRLNADAVEVQHVTDIDGVAAAAVTFAQVTANG